MPYLISAYEILDDNHGGAIVRGHYLKHQKENRHQYFLNSQGYRLNASPEFEWCRKHPSQVLAVMMYDRWAKVNDGRRATRLVINPIETDGARRYEGGKMSRQVSLQPVQFKADPDKRMSSDSKVMNQGTFRHTHGVASQPIRP